jgi:hypothetical protein
MRAGDTTFKARSDTPERSALLAHRDIDERRAHRFVELLDARTLTEGR